MLAVTAALVVASLALNLYLLGQMGRQLHQAARLARALEVAADLEGGLRQALASSVAPPTLRALADELADLAGAEGAAAVREGVAAGRHAEALAALGELRPVLRGRWRAATPPSPACGRARRSPSPRSGPSSWGCCWPAGACWLPACGPPCSS